MESTARTLKYVEIYNELKQRIVCGQYLKGDFLPSESEICAEYRVSRTSARKALSMLEAEGLTRTHQGKGSEVLYGTKQIRSKQIQVYRNVINISSEYLLEGESFSMNSVIDRIPADESLSKAMQLPVGTGLFRVRRLKAIGSTPFSYVVSFVPREIAPQLEEKNGKVFFLYQYLRDECGIVSTSVEEKISCSVSKYLESNLLGIPLGAPVLVTKRTAKCAAGVMEYTETWIRPDIYQISVSMDGDIKYADDILSP